MIGAWKGIRVLSKVLNKKHQIICALFLQILVLLAGTAPAVSAYNNVTVDLKVADSDGKSVPEFEAALFTHKSGKSSWRQGSNGAVSFRPNEPPYDFIETDQVTHVIVRACGYAPHILKLDRPEGNIREEIRLKKGLGIHLVLETADTRAIPESLIPTVVFREYESRAWLGKQTYNGEYRHRIDFNLTAITKKGPGHFVFNVSEQSPDIFILIEHPGFLRAFRAGPFSEEDLKRGQLKIELPEPTTLEVVFGLAEDIAAELPYGACKITVGQQVPETDNTFRPVTIIRTDTPYLHMAPEYLAPGQYMVRCETGPGEKSAPWVQGQIHPAYFHDYKKISLSPGQTEKMVFEYIPYDENAYKGDYDATVIMSWANDKSVAGLPYTLYYADRHFLLALIQEGAIPDNGRIELTGLRGGAEAPHFLLQIEKGRLGHYFIQLLGGEKTRRLEYKLAPSEGSMAPNITLLDVFTGENVQLEDYRGQIIFIEFWATWCGPCMRPLEDLCKLQRTRNNAWDGKVALFAVSIDDRKDTLVNFVQNQGLQTVRHLWCHEGEPGHKSKPATAYGISSTPSALLIDRSGSIIWRGHPESVDIEAKIAELLNDGKK